jgi:hypothetical protein
MTGPSYHAPTHYLFGTDPLTDLVVSTDLSVTIDTSAGVFDLAVTPGGGGSGIMFDTDPQVGDWLIVTTTGQTTRTFFDPILSSSIPFGVVFEMTPNTLGSGRGMLAKASGDGSPQLHTLDVQVNPTGGISKGIWVTSNPTGTPTLIVAGDTDIEASVAGLTIGWRAAISAAGDGVASGIVGSATTAAGGDGDATGGTFLAQSLGDGNAAGVTAQASSEGLGTAVGVDSIVSGSNTSTNDQIAFRGHTVVGSTGPEAYALNARLDQTGGGVTHLHPVSINVNGTVIFKIEGNGDVHMKSTANIIADL